MMDAKKPFLPNAPSILDMELKPTTWIVPGWIAEGCYHQITGFQGMMKSYLSLWMAREAARAGYNVAYIDIENPPQVVRKRFEVVKVTREDEKNLKYLTPWQPNPPSRNLVGANPYFEWAREHKAVMFFDSLNRFHSFDENNASMMSHVTNVFRKLADLGATVVVLHQSGKSYENQESIYRGSSEIGAGCDIGYKIRSKDDKGKNKYSPILTLAHFKNRLDAEEDKIIIQWSPELGSWVTGDIEKVSAIRSAISGAGGIADRDAILSKINFGRNTMDAILNQGLQQKWWYSEEVPIDDKKGGRPKLVFTLIQS